MVNSKRLDYILKVLHPSHYEPIDIALADIMAIGATRACMPTRRMHCAQGSNGQHLVVNKLWQGHFAFVANRTFLEELHPYFRKHRSAAGRGGIFATYYTLQTSMYVANCSGY
jgi:hypothetical protein